MKLKFLVVGKTTDARIAALVDDYAERLAHYLPIEREVIPELRATKSLSPAQQKQREGELILRTLAPGDRLVLLDEAGRAYRSVDFAKRLEALQHMGTRRAVFCIGGPYGFSPEVYARADEQVSLSPMTFSHQMVRLFFIEQCYRAMTILRGEPYHHE